MIFYYKYYLEIRNRLILVLISWVLTAITCYFYKEILLFLFINLNTTLPKNSADCYFIFTNISEIFSVYLNLIFFISNQVIFLLFIYHSILFISSGLYKLEYEKIFFMFKTFIFSWATSNLLLITFILPTTTNFFLSFQQTKSTSFFFEARITEYFSYFSNLYYICFTSCQLLSLATFILASFSNDKTKIKQFRKLFYLIFLIFATLITPPDVISQFLIGVSLITCYELTLLIILINKEAN